jgi:hypothetical protein
MEERALSGELYRQTTGQWLGFSIVSLALGAATYCAVIGQTAVACTIGALDLVGLAAVFVAGKFFERRSSEQSVARSEKDDE